MSEVDLLKGGQIGKCHKVKEAHEPELRKKRKQLFGIVPGTGGGQICLFVAFFLGEKETHQQNSQEISGKCRDNPVKIMFMRFLVYCFWCWP